MPKKPRPIVFKQTEDMGLYPHTVITVYQAPDVEPIAQCIDNALKPGFYGSASTAAERHATLSRLAERGATHYVHTALVTRIVFDFQHYGADSYCRANVSLSHNPEDLDAHYRFYRKVVDAVARANPRRDWYRPEPLLRGLAQLGALEARYVRAPADFSGDLVIAPEAIDLREAS